MSYQRDLDEYSDLELRNELLRRKELLKVQSCTYCGLNIVNCSCKLKDQRGRERNLSNFKTLLRTLEY